MELLELSAPLLLSGLVITIKISAVALTFGFAIGLALALCRTGRNRLLATFAKMYSLVFRGTPLLTQLFVFYYGLGQLHLVRASELTWWVVSDGARCATLILALNSGAYTSEILRAGFTSVSRNSIEAALACGMSRWLTFRRILLPIAMRQALPAYGNEIILTVKGSSLASTITVLEITGQAKRLMSQTFAVIEIFTIAGAMYLALNIVLIAAMRVLERTAFRQG